jgi:hypothetical protein
MNGRNAKMLRKLDKDDKKSKKLFKALNHIQRGKMRAAFERDRANV